MSEALVAKVVEKALMRWADAQELPLAYENVAFDPPPLDQYYARVTQLPATTTTAFLDGGHRALIGLYQVSIVGPQGKGVGEARRIASTLIAAFPANLVLTDGAFRLQITSPVSIGPSIIDSGSADISVSGVRSARFMLPCSFNYRADIVS